MFKFINAILEKILPQCVEYIETFVLLFTKAKDSVVSFHICYLQKRYSMNNKTNPYGCALCPKTFPVPTALTKHIENHKLSTKTLTGTKVKNEPPDFKEDNQNIKLLTLHPTLLRKQVSPKISQDQDHSSQEG